MYLYVRACSYDDTQTIQKDIKEHHTDTKKNLKQVICIYICWFMGELGVCNVLKIFFILVVD